MTTNASHIFYIARSENYGQSIDDKTTGEFLGMTTSSAKLHEIDFDDYFRIPGTKTFSLKMIYPGLIIGAGYSHVYRKKENEDRDKEKKQDFQLGFFFDHKTGMPVIPGSSVKGVLKAVFPKPGDQKEIRDEKEKYILEIGGNKLTKDLLSNWEEIFFKRNQVFHDAYLSGISTGTKIFADDYITPHTKGIFKNPEPHRFLKIAPGVTFTFQFKLHDFFLNGDMVLSKANIKEIFKQILLDFGIGAKRNVGYGAFIG